MDEHAGDEIDRMNRCGWNASKQLGRAATTEEIWKAYHDQNLNTGEDHDGNRWRLCATSAEWLGANFKPCRAGNGFDPACYSDLIRRHVGSDIRDEIRKRNRSRYSDEELAVVLYTIEKGSLSRHKDRRHQFTVGNESLASMFRTLGRPLGDGDEKANRKKLSAMKEALVRAKLGAVVDGNWFVGVSKKYGLGEQHPRYEESVRFAEGIGCPIHVHPQEQTNRSNL